MSQQAASTSGAVGSTTTAAGRKRKKSPKPKETKRAPGDAPKRTKVAQRKEQEAADAATAAAAASASGAGGTQSQSHSQSAGDDDEVVAPRSPIRRRRVINTDPPETPTPSHVLPGNRVKSESQSADTFLGTHAGDVSSTSSHPGNGAPAQTWAGQTTSGELRGLFEAQNAQLHQLGLCMRETGLIMRELLKFKLGQPASMPQTPTLDGGFTTTSERGPETSSQTGVATAGRTENGPLTGALGLFHGSAENGQQSVGDRSTLGIGQPPPRPPMQTPSNNNPTGFANGVAFNIGPITQPVTVAPLPPPERKAETASNASPALPGSAQPSESHHQLHAGPFGGSSSGDHPPQSAPAATSLYRDTSHPHMVDTPRNPSFPIPGQQSSIQTPQIPTTQPEDQNMGPSGTTAPAQGVHSFMLPNQTYSNMPNPTFGFVRPGLTPQQTQQQQQQQQAFHQHIQQQQQQAHILAQLQRQTAMARQGSQYYPQPPQMTAMHPGARAVSGNPTMARPPRPFMNLNTGLGIMQPGDGSEHNGSDSANPSAMTPDVVQLARLQRQAMGYMRHTTNTISVSPSNPATTTAFPPQFPGQTTPAMQNPFLGAVALSISPQPANGVPSTSNPPVGGFGGGGASGSLGAPAPAPTTGMASGATSNGMGTPNMYSLYDPSFAASFAGLPSGGDISSPFSFAPPEMDAGGGVGRPRWGEDDGDDEPLREVTPGKRFDK